MDITFHYPPDLFQLLVDTLPKLCKGKKDLMLFFQGAGIGNAILSDLWQQVMTDPDSIYKTEIARSVLTRLNERGEATLGERRELLRRVVDFEDFSTCWPKEQAAAKGYVADVRRIVNVKDSFTRMQQERDRERHAHINQKEAQAAELQQRKAAKDAVRNELFTLFKAGLEPHQRGRDLEAILNRLFQLDGILIRESFRRKGEEGHTIEQIDGAVDVAGHLYLVEVKWHNKPTDVQDVQVLLSRLFLRPEARGIFISAEGYTKSAEDMRQQAASHKVLLLCSLSEIVHSLVKEEDFSKFFKAKADLAITELRK